MADNNIMTDALSRAITYDVTGDIDAKDRVLHRDLATKCDCPYPAALAAVDEVQDGAAGDRTGGTMDLTITLVDGQVAIVTGVAWNAAASAVQTAVDAQCATDITDYVAGDISVTGGPFGAAGSTTVFTFVGNSVRGNHPLVTVDGTSLTGGTTNPVFTEDTAGIVPRFWFAALREMGVITGTDPSFGDAPAGQYTVVTQDTLENYPDDETIKRLVKEATVVEGQDWETELLPPLNIY